MKNLLTISFYEGMLQLRGDADKGLIYKFFKPHPFNYFISPAYKYAEILKFCSENNIQIEDHASHYFDIDPIVHSEELDPFDFQIEAIKAWEKSNRRGLIVLPTGAGKSFLTRLLITSLAIEDTRSSVLIIVPTLVLLYQWHRQLRKAFGIDIGIIGDDIFDLQPVTITTYASARIHMAHFGNRWKLVVYDEVHRKISGRTSSNVAMFCLAPYRLGLTATPSEKNFNLLSELIGPVVYEKSTEEMIDLEVLSVFERIPVRLSPTKEEIKEFMKLKAPMENVWRRAREQHRVQDGSWLVRERMYYPDEVDLAQHTLLRAYRYWQSIPSRFLRLEEILIKHPKDRILIFTESRNAAYEISQRFLIPAITADIDTDERAFYLKAFSAGKCRALVTAKALEEGIDLPDANVAIILSGRKRLQTETISYIQRRGRILRKRKGKEALVYEIAWAAPQSSKKESEAL
jgi:superfamily II DNA or RNA helicase